MKGANDMAVLLGGLVGSALGMLVICYGIYRVVPKKLTISLPAQAVISGLVTFYLSTDREGIHYRQIDVMSNWAGWVLALVIMALYLFRKRSHSRSNP